MCPLSSNEDLSTPPMWKETEKSYKKVYIPSPTKISRTSSKILYVDAYDSYANNIIALVKQRTLAEVAVIHHDDSILLQLNEDQWGEYLAQFDGAIAGPGPGNPNNAGDVGLISRLWTDQGSRHLPVLGICLGFQSLGLAFGASVRRLKDPKHGMLVKMVMNPHGLFGGAFQTTVVQYNSLYVDLGYDDGETVTPARWKPSKKCPDIEPLAWRVGGPMDDPVIFGMKHATKPFWGVQYHPESICTDYGGSRVIDRWLDTVNDYWQGKSCIAATRPRMISNSSPTKSARNESRCHVSSTPCFGQGNEADIQSIADMRIHLSDDRTVHWRKIPLGSHDTASIKNAFASRSQSILLESGTKPNGDPVRPDTGRFSIIGIQYANKLITFTWNTKDMDFTMANEDMCRNMQKTQNPWSYLEHVMEEAKMNQGCPGVPFWGGLVGFVSYEGCLPCINVQPSGTGSGRPDMCFAFVHRSIVVDHIEKTIYIQTIAPEDDAWVTEAVEALAAPGCAKSGLSTSSAAEARMVSATSGDGALIISQDTAKPYQSKVTKAQEHIAAGSSYELCLTGTTHLSLPRTTSAKDLYASLRTSNPAPFSAHISLPLPETGRVTILSSSPERFLSWSRTGRCQFRPIKGTVRKSPTTTRAAAEAILKSSKEQAENLMIVDLIRHDLHGVVGAGNVHVPKLMGVEEYETCYQLVSVIEGQLPTPRVSGLWSTDDDVKMQDIDDEDDQVLQGESDARHYPRGLTLLRASLPPGSMTGAPKKRSVQLLQELETHKPRGIYSGVLGYLDVGGGGDFSVVIRSAVNWSSAAGDDAESDQTRRSKAEGEQMKSKERNEWTIGAGGAITIQSTPQDEWEEMQGKRATLLDVFLGKTGVESATESSIGDDSSPPGEGNDEDNDAGPSCVLG